MSSYGLQVENGFCARGGVIVYQNLSCTVRGPGAWSVTGPNGSGKTTFLRHLAGLSEGGGQIRWFDGERPLPAESIGFIGTAPFGDDTLTVRDVLTFYQAFTRNIQVTIAQAADQWALSYMLDEPLPHLSAGGRQRLSLARLSFDRRPVWLLDEPSIHLDADGIDRLYDQIDCHIKDGGLVLQAQPIATHRWPVLVDFAYPTTTTTTENGQ